MVSELAESMWRDDRAVARRRLQRVYLAHGDEKLANDGKHLNKVLDVYQAEENAVEAKRG